MIKKFTVLLAIIFIVTNVIAQENVSDSVDTESSDSSVEQNETNKSDALSSPEKENSSSTSQDVESSDIVVTASKMETDIKSVAVPISVFSNERINNSGVATSSEVLAGDSSLYVAKNGGIGGLSSLFLGGAPSNAASVMIDGFRINDITQPSGGFNYSLLNFFGVKQVEVVKGAQSTLYGTDALSGVINVVTNDYSEEDGVKIIGEYSNEKTHDERVAVSEKGERGYLNLNFSHYYSNAYSKADSQKYSGDELENDSDRIYNFLGKGGFALTDTILTEAVCYYSKNDIEVDEGAYQDYSDQKNISEMSFAGAKIIFEPTEKFSLNTKVSYTVVSRIIDNDDGSYGAYYGEFYGTKKFVESNMSLGLGKFNKILIGADFSSEDFESGDSYSKFNKKDVYSYSAFGSNNLEIKDVLYFQLGGRYYKNELSGSTFTYQAALSLQFPSNTVLKGSVSTGYKAPTIYQLYDKTYGNEKLDSEKTFTATAGIEQAIGKKFQLGNEYFYMKYDDMIVSNSSTYVFEMAGGNVKIHQVTFYGKYLYNKKEYLSVKYSYLNAEYKDTEKKLERRPKHKVGTELFKKLTGSTSLYVTYIYNSKRYDDKDNTDSKKLCSYHLVNLKGQYEYSEMISGYVRVENLLNEKYQEVYGYAVPGTELFGGVEVKF